MHLADQHCDSIAGGPSMFQVYHTPLDGRQIPGQSSKQLNSNLYKISLATINYPIHYSGFPPVANCSTLFFIHPLAKHYEEYKEGIYYECTFTPDYVDEITGGRSEKDKLFNPESPTAFLINRTQEWRIEEIFESMLEENGVIRPYKSEMLQNLIAEIALFSLRLIPVNLKS